MEIWESFNINREMLIINLTTFILFVSSSIRVAQGLTDIWVAERFKRNDNMGPFTSKIKNT